MLYKINLALFVFYLTGIQSWILSVFSSIVQGYLLALRAFFIGIQSRLLSVFLHTAYVTLNRVEVWERLGYCFRHLLLFYHWPYGTTTSSQRTPHAQGE